MSLALGKQVHGPDDPVGRMFSSILATFAGFESDLFRLHTRKSMKIVRDKGKPRGTPPQLSDLQQRKRLKIKATGEYSIGDLSNPP